MHPPNRKSSLLFARAVLLFCAAWVAWAVAPASLAAQPGEGIRSDADVRDIARQQDAPSDSSDKAPSGLLDFLRMFGALALVLGLIVLAGYLLRRYGAREGAAPGRSDVIRVVSTKMLGSRRSLMLVRVRGQTLLLGLTPQSIHCLTEIHEIDGEWAQPPSEKATGASSSFNRQLGQLVNETIADDAPRDAI